jgi:hypothetical protein
MCDLVSSSRDESDEWSALRTGRSGGPQGRSRHEDPRTN